MQIFWVNIDNIKYTKLIENITRLEKQNIVFTPNPEILLNTLNDKEFLNNLKKADYLTNDGIWLYLAYQIIDNNFWRFVNTILIPYFIFNLFFKRKKLYKKYWDRICGSDLTKDLINFAIKNNIKISIIDLYNPNDINKINSQKIFEKKLKSRFKNLDFDYYVYNPEKKQEIINKIKKSDSKILFSTLWMKKQETSVIEVLKNAKNIKIWLWVGSSFDYFVWFQKRAPKIWRKIWLEWFYRLFMGPKKFLRLKRLYNAIFVFMFQVIKNKK